MRIRGDHIDFEAELKTREITRLVHFTPCANILPIFQIGGLFSRDRLKNIDESHPEMHLGDYSEVNDQIRLDRCLDYVNCSIMHPNTWLLDVFRNKYKTREWGNDWCIFILDPRLVLLEDTLFSVGNAAASYSKSIGIGTSISCFQAMFAERIAAYNQYGPKPIVRGNLLPSAYPTDPQAEVLVKEKIGLESVISVAFENDIARSQYASAVRMIVPNHVGRISFEVNTTLFKSRSALWQ